MSMFASSGRPVIRGALLFGGRKIEIVRKNCFSGDQIGRSLEEYPKNRRSSKQAAATRGRQHGRFPTKRRVSNLLVFREEMPMVITFRCNHNEEE